MVGKAVKVVEASDLVLKGITPFVILHAPTMLPAFEEAAKAYRRLATWQHVVTRDPNSTTGNDLFVALHHRSEEPINLVGDLDSKDRIIDFITNYSFPFFGLLDGESFSKYMERGIGLVWVLFEMSEVDRIEEVAEKNREVMIWWQRNYGESIPSPLRTPSSSRMRSQIC